MSGALGAGHFGPEPAASADLGIDVAGDSFTAGAGGRLRWVGDEGLRRADWDERSEWATILRYAVYRRQPSGGVAVAAAAGQLGDASIGHGVVVDRFATGVDVDHRRLGLQLRAGSELGGGELLIDDVVAPRAVAGRASFALVGPLALGIEGAVDIDAPSTVDGGATMHDTVPIASADLAVARELRDGGRATLYTAVAGIAGGGAGLHVGVAGDVALADGDARLAARAELRAGSDRYVPGWFGPLHDVERERRRDRVDDGGLAGAGGLAQLRGELAEIGSLALGYAGRPGLPDLVTVRAALPDHDTVQIAAWLAAAVGSGDRERLALSAEARIRLGGPLFVAAELSRLYRREMDALAPVWIGSGWFGAVVGE